MLAPGKAVKVIIYLSDGAIRRTRAKVGTSQVPNTLSGRFE